MTTKTRQRTRHTQPTFSLRNELMQCVISHNPILRNVAQTMTNEILLYNCHPLYRWQYGERLFKEGHFTEDEWYGRIQRNLKKYQ